MFKSIYISPKIANNAYMSPTPLLSRAEYYHRANHVLTFFAPKKAFAEIMPAVRFLPQMKYGINSFLQKAYLPSSMPKSAVFQLMRAVCSP
ncbi:hypothetical protein SNOG_10028 [Parastagonospora nodorum SN15]|uniref:Uncharacterized protein n=1 Tax=Phaeosphaeria nodorum (strain SN15 / ATCC MYA-4574 / FGSC 10173) TaxID=321614 RepID=Q0UDY6_PHANO|nr:hypothetical protein SNOG_10028 [Parastagonospora nodorum SN15]EAT82363.1 hypothetical protein SNOG_10028 [Parastagonospora nodorum SN15]